MIGVQSIPRCRRRSSIVGAPASRLLLRFSASFRLAAIPVASARRCSSASVLPDCESTMATSIAMSRPPLVADTVGVNVCGLLAGPREQVPRLATHLYPRVFVDRCYGVAHQVVVRDLPSPGLTAESVPPALHVGGT